MSTELRDAIENYHEHITTCPVCVRLGDADFCAAGNRLAENVGKAQGALILASIQQPAGGVQ